jgi:apolipoprotein N-acyltransferase
MPLGLAFVVAALGLARSGREALIVGICFGAARYLVAAHFILYLMRYSPLALAFYLLAVAFVLPFALLESGGAYLLAKRSRMPRGIALGLIYGLGEHLRTLGDLSFPGDLGAHGFGQYPLLLEWTRFTGPFVIPVWLFAVATLVERAAAHRRDRPKLLRFAAGAVGVWLILPAGGLLAQRSGEAQTFRVGIVQPAVTVEVKFDRSRHAETWRTLEQLTARAARGVDLVIWPETGRPDRVIWDERGPFRDVQMEALSREVGVPILYGLELVRKNGDETRALYNAAALAYPDGRPSQWYGKQRLLPFAEAVPFADWIGWKPAYQRENPQKKSYLTMLGNFIPGPEATVFEVGPARIGVMICYEGLYPRIARVYRQSGCNLLCVMTNDEWWGESVFAPLHALMVSSRAQENDIPVVRSANSGVSSGTDRNGRLTDTLGISERGVLQVDVALRDTPPTVYTRYGNWATVLLLVVALGAWVRPWFSRRG